MKYTRAYTVVWLLSALVCFVTPSGALADIYMQIDEGIIPGESTAAGYEGWIEVLAVSEGQSISASTDPSTVGRVRGSVNFNDIAVAKFIDKASTRLRLFNAQGRSFSEVVIVVTKTEDRGSLPVFTIRLNNAIITTVSAAASAGEARPTENLTLGFEQIQWEYQYYRDDGSSGAKNINGWDLGRNTGQ